MADRLTRRRRKQERQRAAVLAAAQAVFCAKGFEQASMAEIAERAEFSVGTLYNLFKDKRDIYNALVRETVAVFVGRLLAALDGPGDDIARLHRFIDAQAALYVEHAPLARLYFAETAGSWIDPTVGLDADVRALCTAVRSRTEAVIQAAMGAGQLRRADPHLLAIGLEGIGQALFRAMLENTQDHSADQVAEAMKLIFFESVRGDV